jgi:hypothetical protein
MDHEFEGEALPYDNRLRLRPVDIGRNVWIGMNVCIAPGTKIGDGAIVGMGTVVAGEVPPLAIVASQPWRIIGHRDSGRYQRLDTEGRYGAAGGVPLPPRDAVSDPPEALLGPPSRLAGAKHVGDIDTPPPAPRQVSSHPSRAHSP